MPRDRLYASNAERQAAYRNRVAGLSARRESALSTALRRAETAERRADTAEAELAAAKAEITTLRLTLAGVTDRLNDLDPDSTEKSSTSTGSNRQARRQAERDARRRRR